MLVDEAGIQLCDQCTACIVLHTFVRTVPVFDDMERMVDVVSSKIRTRMGKSAISRNVAEFSGF